MSAPTVPTRHHSAEHAGNAQRVPYAPPIIQTRHIDLAPSQSAPRAPQFDSDIEHALELGKITLRRARALQEARKN